MTPQHHPVQSAGRFAGTTGLTCERLVDHTVVAISGELDAAATSSMRERLHVALRDVGAYVIVDLSGVTFCDASGLAMLIGVRRRAEAMGASMILADPRPQPAGLLQAAGLLRAFTVRTSGTGARTAAPDTRSAAA